MPLVYSQMIAPKMTKYMNRNWSLLLVRMMVILHCRQIHLIQILFLTDFKKNWNLSMPKMAVTDLSKLLKSEEIRKVLRAPNRKVTKAVVKTNPLKNVRTMLQLNPYAAVQKKQAELTLAAAMAKKAGAPNKMAKRAAAMAKKK